MGADGGELGPGARLGAVVRSASAHVGCRSKKLPSMRRLCYGGAQKKRPRPGWCPPRPLDCSQQGEKAIRDKAYPPRRTLSSCLHGGEEPLDSGRLYRCARCRTMVVICRRCDRGNVYCSRACSQQRRKEKQAEAGRRYQKSRQGAHNHARRQQGYRERQRQIVTHHRSHATEESLKTASTKPLNSLEAASEEKDESKEAQTSRDEVVQPEPTAVPRAGYRCTWCSSWCSLYVRCSKLRGPQRSSRPAKRRGPAP